MPSTPGHVFWIFGLSGAGKSTLATALTRELRDRQIPVLELDGDILRNGLCNGLGFSDGDRRENLRRAATVAQLGTVSGLCVVASFITPFEVHRQLVREIIGPARISFIFADAPLAVCRQRDVKGLYARAQAGQVPQMTGIGSSFEKPVTVDLILSTSTETADASVRKLVEFALARLG
jgi:adenylyl-sulfate kinase